VSTTPGPNPLLALTPSQVNRAQSEQWRQIIRQSLADTRCAAPAFLITDLDPVTQTVTAQIAIQERVRTSKGTVWMDLPAIPFVPVVIPRGGGYSVTLPLKKGDEGLLVFCDACIDFWWQSGQTNSATGTQRQNEVRRHYIHDCGFVPGMFSQPSVLSDYSLDSLQIRRDDGSALVDINENTVTVTGASLVQLSAPAVDATDGSGTAQALVNDTFYQWYVANIMPFLVSKGYAGPGVPTGSETTILKGQ
jgi:Phage protein Gp138 N-terminal domain